MKHLIESIVIKDYDDANSIIEESLHYIIERKMIEKKKMIMAEKNVWKGMPSSRQEKLYRDVVEENEIIDEMNLSREKPDYSSIEDRRKERGVNSSIKTNLGGEQKVTSGKGDLQGKQTGDTSEKGDLKEEKLDEARIKLVKARIRGGKIERRKRVSNIPGMTLRGGQLKRMSAAERRRRKLGQRKGKLKRKAKMARTLMKRQRSLRRRKSLGI
jgi:hypothetical protein